MNLRKMMKDLQQMQGKLQEQLDTLEVDGSSGGEMVTVRMNGKKEVGSVQIAAEAIDPTEKELLEDMLVAAINAAGQKVDQEVQELTQSLAPGMNLPGMQ